MLRLKILFSIIFVIGNFIRKFLLKIINKKDIKLTRFIYKLCVSLREKTNIVLTCT